MRALRPTITCPALVTAVTLTLSALPAVAGELSLTGEGSVSYTPDSARLQFTARAENTDADAATRQVNQTLTRWEEAIGDYRSQLEDYSDAQLALYSRTLPAENREDTPEQRAVASQTVSFSISDLTLLNPLLAEAQTLGLQYNLGSGQFFHSDEPALARQALARALADAREQCRFIAQEMDMECGEVISLNVHNNNRPVPMMMADSRGAKEAVSEVGPRQLDAQVQATFRID